MSTNKQNLGRLKPVDLREVWPSEDGDFTPWLAGEENIALLGDTIGLELEVEAVEKSVGPFRADILCRDTANNQYVLIENQLQSTDHTHLGQLLTYAAGLDAVTIDCIAEQFSEQHRAALDWLNEITGSRFNFFGLEIEVWRIGDSPAAPKFNIVARPNDWTKGGGGGGKPPERPERLAYWMALREFVQANAADLKPSRPTDGASLDVPLGKTGQTVKVFRYDRRKHLEKNRLGVRLKGPHEVVESLKADQAAIEKAFGRSVFEPGKLGKPLLSVDREAVLDDQNQWPGQFSWIIDTIRRFNEVLAPRLEKLKASGVKLGKSDGGDAEDEE